MTQGDASAALPSLPGGNEPQPAAGPAQVLGEIVFLAMKSPEHRARTLAELEQAILPAVMLRQFRLWRNHDQPIAFAAWALASEEVAARIAAGERALSPAEWRSGDTFVIVDLIAPYGGHEGFERALREMMEGRG